MIDKNEAQEIAFEINRSLKDIIKNKDSIDVEQKANELTNMAKSLCLYVVQLNRLSKRLGNKIIDSYLLIHSIKGMYNRQTSAFYRMEYYFAKMKGLFESNGKISNVSKIALELFYERSVRSLDIFKMEKALDDILKEKLGIEIDGEYINYFAYRKFENRKRVVEQIYVDLSVICNTNKNRGRRFNDDFLRIVKNWSESVI